MNLSGRIQEQRKKHGLSQDQLAENLNVSRQAVSKWESDQSVPDIDKIIAMSDFFNVTTDYLLKGVHHNPQRNASFNVYKSEGFGVISMFFTVINIISLIIAGTIWSVWETMLAFGIALIMQVFSFGIFIIASHGYEMSGMKANRKKFFIVNIPLLSVLIIVSIMALLKLKSS